MRISQLAYRTASWSFVVVGIGHVATQILSPKTPQQVEFIQKMEDFSVNLMGTETNLFSMYLGFSLMMGLMLFAFGWLNLLMLKNNQGHAIPTGILLFNMFTSLVSMVLSIVYLFIVPIVLTGLGFMGFTLSLLYKKTS
jgi:hypothetical protein